MAKWFKNLFGKQEEHRVDDVLKLGEKLKNADLDVKFAQLFTHSGGLFNYCANEQEALQVLYKIFASEHLQKSFCPDETLQKFISAIGKAQNWTPELAPNVDSAFLTCEYLIAYDGRIMLSHNNILHYPPSTLPKKIIFMATVSQIVPDLNAAMMKIKRKSNFKNLTSISGKNASLDGLGASENKLFLILLED